MFSDEVKPLKEHHVGKIGEIPSDRCVVVDLDGVAVGLIRVGDRAYAYENRCLHQGGPVCRGELVGRLEEVLAADGSVAAARFREDEPRLACPWHGWEYDVLTGECAADRRLRLRSFAVRIDGGDVYVRVDES